MIKSQLSMFNLPNLFTAANLICGVFSILLSLHGRIDLAPYPIFLGAVFDFFDGFLARLLKQQGELGKQLDSLADMITFGLAPGIMMLVLLTYSVQYFDNPAIFQIVPENFQFKLIYFSWFEQMIHWGSFSMIPFVGLWITFLSMFRLAKFNIDTRQSDQFIGLNTPANTIFFTSFPLLMFADFPQGSWQNGLITQLIHPYILVPIIVVMSLLLISEIPLFALKFKHFKWKGNQIRFIFLITCSLIIPTCLVWSIPIIVILYILLSLIGNIIKKRVKHEI